MFFSLDRIIDRIMRDTREGKIFIVSRCAIQILVVAIGFLMNDT
jgi:hypothetical protein